MKRTYLFVLFLIMTNTAFAASVYDDEFGKAIWAKDYKKASEMLTQGANINKLSSNIWYNSIPYKTIEYLVQNNYHLNGTDRCILKDIITDDDKDKEMFKKVKYLVSKGADIHCYGKHNASLIYRIADSLGNNMYEPRLQSIEYILREGAKEDLNKYYHYSFGSRKEERKPIYQALIAKNSKLTELFLRFGTKINDPMFSNEKKSTNFPIHMAVRKGMLDSVKMCFDYGANINALWDNLTPLDLAHRFHYNEIELLLINTGAKYKEYSSLNKGPADVKKFQDLSSDELYDHGMKLYYGAGVKKDRDKAVTFLIKAAKKGNSESIKFLKSKNIKF